MEMQLWWAGEGVPWPVSALENPILMPQIRNELCKARSCLTVHSIQSALVRGELLNAFKKLCSLHLAATGMKR